jgi:hypothetical protein
VLVALAPVARADTVYPPDSRPLAVREWCVHWLTPAQAFIAADSTGDRKINLALSQVGFSFRRNASVRWPLVTVGMVEADQSVKRLKDKLGVLVSVGFVLRTGEWDGGRFEPQWAFTYAYDVTSKRHGPLLSFTIGF